MKYVIYDTLGEIVSYGESTLPDDHGLGTLIEGDATNLTHYVANGALVAYNPAQVAAKALRPAHDAVWSNTVMAWADARTLADAQAAQIAALYAAYTAAIANPVAFTTAAGVAQTYQADPLSIGNCSMSMQGYQAAQATPAGFYWLALDNTHVPFTFADLQGLAAALMAQGWPTFAKLQRLKDQVRAATTVGAVVAAAW